MSKKANLDIRILALENGISLSLLGERLGISRSGISKRLRKELPDKEKEELTRVIKEISSEKT